MPDLTITITNLDSLDRALAAAPQGVERTVEQAVITAAPMLEQSIASETPVRTGRLRASESVTPFEPMSLTLEITELHASFVHDGTSRQRANPFIDRGVAAVELEVEGIFEAAVIDFTGDFGG